MRTYYASCWTAALCPYPARAEATNWVQLVDREQRYGRGRPVQRRLTGQSASAVYTLARRVVRTKTE